MSVCPHGSLARQCLVCELQAELAEARDALSSANELVQSGTHSCKLLGERVAELLRERDEARAEVERAKDSLAVANDLLAHTRDALVIVQAERDETRKALEPLAWQPCIEDPNFDGDEMPESVCIEEGRELSACDSCAARAALSRTDRETKQGGEG